MQLQLQCNGWLPYVIILAHDRHNNNNFLRIHEHFVVREIVRSYIHASLAHLRWPPPLSLPLTANFTNDRFSCVSQIRIETTDHLFFFFFMALYAFLHTTAVPRPEILNRHAGRSIKCQFYVWSCLPLLHTVTDIEHWAHREYWILNTSYNIVSIVSCTTTIYILILY